MEQSEAYTVRKKIQDKHPLVTAIAIDRGRHEGDWARDPWGVAIDGVFYDEVHKIPERFL